MALALRKTPAWFLSVGSYLHSPQGNPPSLLPFLPFFPQTSPVPLFHLLDIFIRADPAQYCFSPLVQPILKGYLSPNQYTLTEPSSKALPDKSIERIQRIGSTGWQPPSLFPFPLPFSFPSPFYPAYHLLPTFRSFPPPLSQPFHPIYLLTHSNP